MNNKNIPYNLISRFFVSCVPSLNFALFPMVQTFTSNDLRTNLLKTLNLRNRQRKTRLCLCPGVYGIVEAPQKIFYFAEGPYWRHDTNECSLMKESKVVLDNTGPPQMSHHCESLLQESQF